MFSLQAKELATVGLAPKEVREGATCSVSRVKKTLPNERLDDGSLWWVSRYLLSAKHFGTLAPKRHGDMATFFHSILLVSTTSAFFPQYLDKGPLPAPAAPAPLVAAVPLQTPGSALQLHDAAEMRGGQRWRCVEFMFIRFWSMVHLPLVLLLDPYALGNEECPFVSHDMQFASSRHISQMFVGEQDLCPWYLGILESMEMLQFSQRPGSLWGGEAGQTQNGPRLGERAKGPLCSQLEWKPIKPLWNKSIWVSSIWKRRQRLQKGRQVSQIDDPQHVEQSHCNKQWYSHRCPKSHVWNLQMAASGGRVRKAPQDARWVRRSDSGVRQIKNKSTAAHPKGRLEYSLQWDDLTAEVAGTESFHK